MLAEEAGQADDIGDVYDPVWRVRRDVVARRRRRRPEPARDEHDVRDVEEGVVIDVGWIGVVRNVVSAVI